MVLSGIIIALLLVFAFGYIRPFSISEEKVNLINYLLFGRQKKLLTTHFEYYRQLNDWDKKEFLIRVNTIIKSKNFVSKGNLFVTTPMKTLIAASITQLTFGFKKYLLPQYKTIFVYPDAYVNRHTQKLFKGETNTTGYISLAWNYFLHGYSTTDDRKNLGLHESAHALLNTIIYSNLHDPELDAELLELDKIPAEEKNRLFSGDDPFFRDYGRRNIREFFAVAVECFFEAPEQFKRQFPVFYNLMCQLLNQDPVNRQFRG